MINKKQINRKPTLKSFEPNKQTHHQPRQKRIIDQVINESLSVLRGGNKSSISPNSKDNFILSNPNLGKLEDSELKQSIKVS